MKSKSSDVIHLDLASPTTACGGTQNIGQRHFTSLCNQGICASGYQEFEFSQKISLGSRSFHPTPDLRKKSGIKMTMNCSMELRKRWHLGGGDDGDIETDEDEDEDSNNQNCDIS